MSLLNTQRTKFILSILNIVVFITLISVSNVSAQTGTFTLLGSAETRGHGFGLYVFNDLVYMAGESGGSLSIVDVSNPSSPVSLGDVVGRGGGYVNDIYVADDIAYLSLEKRGEGLAAIDVSDPTNPTGLETFNTPRRAYGGVYADAGIVVLASDFRLDIFDVGDPNQPQLVGSASITGRPNDIHVANGLAYVAVYAGFDIVDVSDPSNPEHLSYIFFESEVVPTVVMDVDVVGEIAYVISKPETLFHPENGSTMTAIDVSDPTAPIILGDSGRDNERYYGIDVVEDIAYVVGDNGVKAFYIGNPESPLLVGTSVESGFDIQVENNVIYLSGNRGIGEGVLKILEFSPPPLSIQINQESTHIVSFNHVYITIFGIMLSTTTLWCYLRRLL